MNKYKINIHEKLCHVIELEFEIDHVVTVKQDNCGD